MQARLAINITSLNILGASGREAGSDSDRAAEAQRSEVPPFSASHLVHDIHRVLDCNRISIVDTFGKCSAPVFDYHPKRLDLNLILHTLPDLVASFDSIRPSLFTQMEPAVLLRQQPTRNETPS